MNTPLNGTMHWQHYRYALRQKFSNDLQENFICIVVLDGVRDATQLLDLVKNGVSISGNIYVQERAYI